MTAPVCVDCIAEGQTRRRAVKLTRAGKPAPGQRCSTHHRARRSQTKDAAWERRLMSVYSITAEEYWAIYEYQGGCCYLCRRANGTGRRRLCVDHCHLSGRVRGLLCSHCNRDVVGHFRDEWEAFCRGAIYLLAPPAFDVIGERVAPAHAGLQLLDNLTDTNERETA